MTAVSRVSADAVTDLVANLCVKANTCLNPDIMEALAKARDTESDDRAKNMLGILMENADIARDEQMPICQDTGMALVFIELGQKCVVTDGDLTEAVNKGVRLGYQRGYLRYSVVKDPILRDNTGDNTPAVIYTSIVPGNSIKITVAPKGFGSENMSRLSMLTPAQGLSGVEDFVVETVKAAQGNPCPPVIVGVGVGGTMDLASLMAKKALLRPVGLKHPDPFWFEAEQRLLERINNLGIGPSGLGGKTTALAVHINTFATHIAGLPVAVNMGCHATRHASGVVNGQ